MEPNELWIERELKESKQSSKEGLTQPNDFIDTNLIANHWFEDLTKVHAKLANLDDFWIEKFQIEPKEFIFDWIKFVNWFWSENDDFWRFGAKNVLDPPTDRLEWQKWQKWHKWQKWKEWKKWLKQEKGPMRPRKGVQCLSNPLKTPKPLSEWLRIIQN